MSESKNLESGEVVTPATIEKLRAITAARLKKLEERVQKGEKFEIDIGVRPNHMNIQCSDSKKCTLHMAFFFGREEGDSW